MEYIEHYFNAYPGIKAFLDRMVEQGHTNEYVTTMFGRRRPIPEIKSSNYMQRQFGERIAMNSPIQGTAADIMKIAMTKVNKRLKEEKLQSRIVLQVHDELLIETKEAEKDKVIKLLEKEMRGAVDMKVSITGGVGAGKSSVLAILEKEYNAKLILADEVGRELMQPGEANYVNIVNAFGKEILNEDQTIDTKKLAATAFSNPLETLRLNAITHPNVRVRIEWMIKRSFVQSAVL